MNPSGQSVAVATAMFAAMAAYALFAGADLGAGVWDALAGGTARGQAPRAAIRKSVGSVYEANNVWIVFVLVIFWTGFPSAFATAMTQLFVPLAVSLLGIMLRGLGFAFRQEADRLPLKSLTTTLFAGSSLVVPFFMGTAVGAVATGRVHMGAGADSTAAWTGPVSIVTGALFATTCAYIGAVYLVDDCRKRGNEKLSRYFGVRAIAAGLVTGGLAALNLYLLSLDAPYVFGRLRSISWPLIVVSVVAGTAVLGMIVFGATRFVRPVAAIAVVAVVAGWGWAQYPFVFPRSLTLAAASGPATALDAQLVVIGLAIVLVAPAFGYLYWLQQHEDLSEGGSASTADLREAVAAENQGLRPASPSAGGDASPALVAVVVGAAALEFARESVAAIRRNRT